MREKIDLVDFGLIHFTDVDSLNNWLKDQAADDVGKTKPFCYKGHVVGTTIDPAVIPKWGRI